MTNGCGQDLRRSTTSSSACPTISQPSMTPDRASRSTGFQSLPSMTRTNVNQACSLESLVLRPAHDGQAHGVDVELRAGEINQSDLIEAFQMAARTCPGKAAAGVVGHKSEALRGFLHTLPRRGAIRTRGLIQNVRHRCHVQPHFFSDLSQSRHDLSQRWYYDIPTLALQGNNG